MRKLIWFLCLVGLLPATRGEAETLYIGDTLRVGVRASQSDNSAALTVITTGAAVEVLEHKGGHLKVRTAGGVEGWIKSAYATIEKPAIVVLKETQRELAELRKQGGAAPAAAPAANDDHNAVLQRELELLRDENKSLRTQVQGAQIAAGTMLKPQPSPFETSMPNARALILYTTGGIVLCFALGFLLGVSWHRGQVSKRLGGFSL